MITDTPPAFEALTFQQISAFCTVFERGGYAGASEALGVAAPTIWEQVKSLEKIYRTKLFARSGRNVEPTARGAALYEMLRPLLATAASTFDRLAEQAEGGVPQISLVTGVRMMLEELAEPLRQFQKQYPNTLLRLMTADNATAQQRVLDGHADLAFLIEPPPEMLAGGMDYEVLYPIEFLVALPPRHRLIRCGSITLADLREEPLILGSAETIGRKRLEQACFRLGLKSPLRVIAETDNSAVTIACVRAGLGIGIIASRSAGQLTRTVPTRSLASEIGQVNVVAAYRKGRQFTEALRSLIDLMHLHGCAG